jgi:O-methyltransferase involved in polyketide biosynthesis
MERVRDLMAKTDPARDVPRTDELWYFEEREPVGEWYARHGWNVTVTPAAELMADFGRSAAPEVKDMVPGNEFVNAQRA